MATKISTGLSNKLLDTGSLKSLLAGNIIRIYAAVSVPATADDAVTGTLLCTITKNGDGTTGLTFAAAASNRVLSKEPSEVWQGTIIASGTAAYFRQVLPADDGALSTTALRIQGLIGTVGADLNLSSVALTAGAPQLIDAFNVALPSF